MDTMHAVGVNFRLGGTVTRFTGVLFRGLRLFAAQEPHNAAPLGFRLMKQSKTLREYVAKIVHKIR